MAVGGESTLIEGINEQGVSLGCGKGRALVFLGFLGFLGFLAFLAFLGFLAFLASRYPDHRVIGVEMDDTALFARQATREAQKRH